MADWRDYTYSKKSNKSNNSTSNWRSLSYGKDEANRITEERNNQHLQAQKDYTERTRIDEENRKKISLPILDTTSNNVSKSNKENKNKVLEFGLGLLQSKPVQGAFKVISSPFNAINQGLTNLADDDKNSKVLSGVKEGFVNTFKKDSKYVGTDEILKALSKSDSKTKNRLYDKLTAPANAGVSLYNFMRSMDKDGEYTPMTKEEIKNKSTTFTGLAGDILEPGPPIIRGTGKLISKGAKALKTTDTFQDGIKGINSILPKLKNSATKPFKANTSTNIVEEVIKTNDNLKSVNMKPGETVSLNDIAKAQSKVKSPKIETATNEVASSKIEDLGRSKFVTNSVKNSNIAPEAMKTTIEAPPYIKVNNQDTWSKALKDVDNNPQQSLLDYLGNNTLKSADDTALGQALIVKAIKEGRVTDANEISIDLAEKLSKAGQTVQAAAIFKKLTPEGMLQYANNKVNRINKVLEKEGRKIPKVKLTDNEVDTILKRMKEFQGMPEGDAKNIKIAQVMQIINNKQPSNLVDKIRAARNISLLGNIKTNVRNVTGNTIMGVTDNVSNVVATPIDKIVSLKTGQRVASIPNLGIQAKGFVKGSKDAIQDSFGGIKLSDLKGKTIKEKAKILSEGFNNPIDRGSNNAKFENSNRLAFDNKIMRAAENVVGTALKVGDNSFKTAYYDDILNQLMKSNKVKVATDEMKQIAQLIADERTYQDSNTISKLAMGIKNLPQKIPNGKAKDAVQIFIDSQLPYVKTPANLLKRAIEYTPAGILEGGIKLNKLFKDGAKTGNYNMALQRNAIDRLSRGLVGSGIVGLGALGAKSGILNGSADKDKDKAAFDKQNGKQPYSINLPNGKNFNYDWAQPLSMPLSGGVQMIKGKDGKPVENTLNAVSNALNFYADQPMLQSIQKLVGSQYDSKGIGERIIEAGLQLPNQFVPTALKQYAQTKDDTVRSTYSPNTLERLLTNPIKAKIPGLSGILPAKIDTFGNEVKQYQGNNSFFNTGINPGYLSTVKNDDTIKAIEDLYNETSEKIHFPRVAPYSIKNGKEPDVDLTPQEIEEYQKKLGEETKKIYENNLKVTSNGYKYTTNVGSVSKNYKDKNYQAIKRGKNDYTVVITDKTDIVKAISSDMTDITKQINMEILKKRGLKK